MGGRARLIIGKHSGRSALTHCLIQQGITVTPEETHRLLDAVRELAVRHKGPVSSKEVMELFYDLTRTGA